MKSFSFIGGDYRNLLLSNMLEKSGKVLRFGLNNSNTDKLSQCLKSDYIIFPIPFSKDEYSLYSPLYDGEISIEECVKYVENKTVFGGNVDINTRNILNNIVVNVVK